MTLRTFLTMVFITLAIIISSESETQLFAADGKTELNVGQPSFIWTGNVAKVSIDVTHEINSDALGWAGEAREAWEVLTFNPFGNNPIPTFSTGFPKGPPSPGKGPKTITYTFDVQNGWDIKFTARMLYTPKGGGAPAEIKQTINFTAQKK